jgi:hypothetical protein
MVWFHVDDGLAYHKKVMEAGNAAIGLWVRAGAWCTGSLTDGFIPNAIARSLGTPSQVQKLVDSGLWVRVNGGFKFHDWEHRQFTKEEVEAKRERERVKKRDQRRRQNVPQGQPRDVPAELPGDIPEDVPPPVPEESLYARAGAQTPPHPTPPLNGNHLEGGSHVSSAATSNEPPPPFCPEHMPDGTNGNCGRCGTYRRARQRWDEVHERRLAEERAEADREARLEAAATNAMAIAECELCDDEGYAGGRICHHNPDQATTNANGIAMVRAELARTRGGSS